MVFNRIFLSCIIFFVLSCSNETCKLDDIKLIDLLEKQGFDIVKKSIYRGDVFERKLIGVMIDNSLLLKKNKDLNIITIIDYELYSNDDSCTGIEIEIFSSKNKGFINDFYDSLFKFSNSSKLSFNFAKQYFSCFKFENSIVIIHNYCEKKELNIDDIFKEIKCLNSADLINENNF